MTAHLSERTRWTVVMAFAIAMAWVEAASVFYIRALADRIEPYQPNPLPIEGALGNVELWREAATLVMIATLGVLAGRTWRRRAGYAALAFGAWDIFYYVFLRLISGWPRTKRSPFFPLANGSRERFVPRSTGCSKPCREFSARRPSACC